MDVLNAMTWVCGDCITMGARTERVRVQKPVATSQILMDLSRDADTRKSPLGTNVTDDTLWSCPGIRERAVKISISRTVHGFDAVERLKAPQLDGEVGRARRWMA